VWQMFTERARRVVFFAQEEAGRLRQNCVSTEHLLLGLVRENDNVAPRILDRMGVSLGRIRSEIEGQVTRGDGRLCQDMQLTPRCMRVLDLAYDEARQLSNNYIGTEHLLLGLIREGEGLTGRVLAKLGVELERTRREVMALQDVDSVAQKSQYGYSGMQKSLSNDDWKKLFARIFERLPAEQQAALLDMGVPLDQLSPPARIMIERMVAEGSGDGVFVLNPKAVVRVNITKADGVVYFTITAQVTFLANVLVRES